MRLLTRFDRHVLGRFLSAFALLLGLLVVTFVTFDYAERVDDFLDRGATSREVFGTYYPHYAFDILRLVSPLAAFLAAVYVTARLAQSLQLAALQAAGVSVRRYARPLALAALVLTAGLVAFGGWAVPRANRVVFDIQNRYFADAGEAAGGESFRQAAPGVTLAVGFFEREAGRAFRVSLVEEDTLAGRAVARRLDAAEMEWVDSLAVWRMRSVTERWFAGGTERFRSVDRLDTVLAVTPADLAQTERATERLTLPESRAYLASLARAGVADRNRATVGVHSKLAYPLSTLVLTLLAVPLAARRRRGGQAVALALGLGVAFLYFALQRTLEPLGAVGDLPPVVAVWAPHAVVAALTALAYLRVR